MTQLRTALPRTVVVLGLVSLLNDAASEMITPLLPIFLNVLFGFASHNLGLDISHAIVSNIELMIFGGLIIFFLIVEPHGLARLWQIGKEKLRLWPFPH